MIVLDDDDDTLENDMNGARGGESNDGGVDTSMAARTTGGGRGEGSQLRMRELSLAGLDGQATG